VKRAAAITAATLLSWLALGSGRAVAQVPAPPPEAEPVLELIAPTVSPVCGNAVLAVTLGPAIIAGSAGVAIPPEVLPAFGPVFIVCGSVPAPPQRLNCVPDATARGAIDTVTGTAAGTALPIDTSLIGPAAEQVVVLEDTLGAPANSAGLGAMAVGTLQCTVIEAPTAPEEEPASEVSPETETAPEEDLGFEDALGLPDLSGVTTDYGDLGATSPTEAQLGSADAPIAPVVLSSGFAYPIVFVMPLALLALVGYFGWALTRPIATDPTDTTAP
jgi:hypothetical protein